MADFIIVNNDRYFYETTQNTIETITRKIHEIVINLYSETTNEKGLLSFSTYNNNTTVWINKIACGIQKLKGGCAKILFSLLYFYLKEKKFYGNTSLALIVQPDIDYEFYLKELDKQINDGTYSISLNHDEKLTRMDIIRKYLIPSANEKLTKLYESIGFKTQDHKMVTTLNELIIFNNILQKGGGLSSRKQNTRKKNTRKKNTRKKNTKHRTR